MVTTYIAQRNDAIFTCNNVVKCGRHPADYVRSQNKNGGQGSFDIFSKRLTALKAT